MYPNKLEVNKASNLQICKWYRFLPSPANAAEIEINNLILYKFNSFGGMSPKISKLIGW